MGKRTNSRGGVEATAPLHYFYIRVGEGKSATIRCEKARDPRQACKMAYGVIYDSPTDTARYKDIGTVKPANLSMKRKRELEKDEGWLPIPPAEGERRRLPISTPVKKVGPIKKESEIKKGLYGFHRVDKDNIQFCYDLRLKQEPFKILVHEGVTYDRQAFGPIFPDATNSEPEGNVWYSRRKVATSSREEAPKTSLVEKLKGNGATPPKKCVGWKWQQTGAQARFGILQIMNGDTIGDYLAEYIMPDIHRLTKLEADRTTSYIVIIGAAPSCGCDGFKHRKTCKHVEALTTMRKEGKL
jgi:hypothetical protein